MDEMTHEQKHEQAKYIASLLTSDTRNPFGMMRMMFCKGTVLYDEKGIYFCICRNQSNSNVCHIVYDAEKDLFDMTFYRRTKKKDDLLPEFKTIKEAKGLFGDCLRSTFQETTGLYTNFKA